MVTPPAKLEKIRRLKTKESKLERLEVAQIPMKSLVMRVLPNQPLMETKRHLGRVRLSLLMAVTLIPLRMKTASLMPM